ncbi:unnamed protein product [Ectocarpus sp. 4 AP-2014]
MGRELELGGSEVVSYLLRHCAGVVARDTAGKGDGPGAATASSPSSSCVVASVPSYFSLRQKRAVLDAASIAGVAMPMVMDEGTAVALAYGILKGGLPPPAPAGEAGARPPLKVTVASFTTSGLTVLGRGCSKGGGTAAAEACVYDRVYRRAREQGIAVEGRPRAEFRLAKALTSAMKTLSANKEARLSVDCIDGDKDLAITLTRKEVEEACAGVAEGVSAACREALHSAGMAAEDVEDVELLGGGSYIPLLRHSVEGTFRDRVRRTMSSSESVARGCALAAAQRSSIFKLRPFQVVDSLTRDLRLVWRYDGGAGDEPTDSNDEDDSSSNGASADGRDTGATTSGRDSSSRSWLPSSLRNDKGAGEETGVGGGGIATGEVDVPAGTPIPWSKEVPVDLGTRDRGQHGGRGRLHVHLMEGAERVASYVIDLAQSTRSTRGKGVLWGGGAVGARTAASAASASERAAAVAATKVKFFFRVDDGGVPSVHSARLEYDEEVTEIVEVPAPVPSTATPSATASLEEEGEGSSPVGGGDGRGDGSESGSEAASAKRRPQGRAEAASRQAGALEEGVAVEEASEGSSISTSTTSTSTSDVSKTEPAAAAEEVGVEGTPEEPKARGEGSREEGGGEGGEEKTLVERVEAEKKIKVPRMFTRRRSRPVRLKQTYSGMLEGPALEEARERERALRAQDEAVRAANEARNALENLLYSSRSSLEPTDGELSPYVSPSDAAAVLGLLDETEAWLYAPEEGGSARDKETFLQRASSLRQRLSEPRARREARAGLLRALGDAEAAAAGGEAQLEEARDSLSASQLRQGDGELASIRRFVAETRQKLEASSVASEGEGGEYGALVGRLPSQEVDVRKKIEHVRKVLAFAKKEHS